MAATDTAAREAIALARRSLEPDPGLAAFIVRDLPETKAAGLTDLAWSLHNHGCSRNDATHILDLLEEYLDGKADHLPDDA